MSDTLTVYVVYSEGHVIVDYPDKRIITCSSMWETEAEANAVLARTFGPLMGNYRSRRRWIEPIEITYDRIDEISVLASNAPEYVTPLHG